MRKPNVDRILTKGSPKQRLLLCLEGTISQGYDEVPMLTEVELKRLRDSFKTDHEIGIYNKAMGYMRAITNYSMHIEVTKNEYMTKIHNLRGLCLLWQEYIAEEETLNKILYTVKDKATKDRIKEITKERFLFFADVKTDREGFIEIVTDKRKKRRSSQKEEVNLSEEEAESPNIEDTIASLGESAKEYLVQIKTMVNVVYYFMERTYVVKGFNSRLKEAETEISKNQAPLPLFNKQFFTGESTPWGEPMPGDESGKWIREHRQKEFKEKEKLYSKYWVFPDYNELEIDQEFFDEQYEEFFKPIE